MNKVFSIPKKNMLRKKSCIVTWNRIDGGGLRNFRVVANERNLETIKIAFLKMVVRIYLCPISAWHNNDNNNKYKDLGGIA